MLSHFLSGLHKTGALFNPPNLYFTHVSEFSEDPPEFTLHMSESSRTSHTCGVEEGWKGDNLKTVPTAGVR